ncbi:hypothetical protein C8J56DRAFT_1087204 [Mycena floridula]|nr:hypothetical protein C8J56DRAFT_1087204 [Mycena floridula]
MNQPSNGLLNKAFKFGDKSGSQNGSPAQPSTLSSGLVQPLTRSDMKQPLTLSDIIPTVAHVQSTLMSMSIQGAMMSIEEDDSVMKSILAKATEISVRPSLDSDSSSNYKRRARDNSNNPNYSDSAAVLSSYCSTCESWTTRINVPYRVDIVVWACYELCIDGSIRDIFYACLSYSL